MTLQEKIIKRLESIQQGAAEAMLAVDHMEALGPLLEDLADEISETMALAEKLP